MAEAAAIGAAVGGIFLLIILLWIAIIGLAIAAFIFWIFMIVDVAQRKFKGESDKVAWILVVVLTGVIGAIIYYFVIKKPNKH